MKMVKEEEFNGGLASCPLDQQETVIDMDDIEKITTKVNRIDPNTANKETLMSRIYTPVRTLSNHLSEHCKQRARNTGPAPPPFTYAPFGTLPGFSTN